jgi:hypothetical protein
MLDALPVSLAVEPTVTFCVSRMLFVKVDVVMIEILAIAMVSVYGVAVLGAFVASQFLSFQITRYFKFRF